MHPSPSNEMSEIKGDGRRRDQRSDTPFKVLILDDDADCVSEYVECVQALGYPCLSSLDPLEALQRIETDPTIGVVVTDLSMPSMNGITFLEEVGARFAVFRPIVPVVVTGWASIDSAVQAMNSNAVDFLTKPVTHEALALALRRAFRRRSQLASSQLLAAFAAAQANDQQSPDETGDEPGQTRSDQQLMKLVRKTIRFRKRRSEYLKGELFSDPSWDILLELTLAKLQGEPVPVSSACAAADVPFTTAYRYVGSLVEQGLVRRWKDPLDQRRVLLELEDATLDAMSEFLFSSGMTD